MERSRVGGWFCGIADTQHSEQMNSKGEHQNDGGRPSLVKHPAEVRADSAGYLPSQCKRASCSECREKEQQPREATKRGACERRESQPGASNQRRGGQHRRHKRQQNGQGKDAIADDGASGERRAGTAGQLRRAPHLHPQLTAETGKLAGFGRS